MIRQRLRGILGTTLAASIPWTALGLLTGVIFQFDLIPGMHFGLGRATQADSIELTWPSGLKESFRDLPANHLFILQETRGIVETRKFR